MTPEDGLFHTELAGAYLTFGHLVLRRLLFLLGDEARSERALVETFREARDRGADLRSMQKKLWWLYRAADRAATDRGA